MTTINFSSFENQLVELYSKNWTEYEEDDSFALGYILKDLEEFILFMSISEVGTLDSIQIRRKKIITKIVTETEYIKMNSFFIDYAKKHNIFDAFSLENSINMENELTVGDILKNVLKLNRTVSIITTTSDNILTGKIILLNIKKLVITLLNYDNIELAEKEAISLDKIVCVDLINVENFLFDQFLTSQIR